MELTRKEMGDIEKNARKDYNTLLKKYKLQQKELDRLIKEESFEIREQFKGVGKVGRKKKYTPNRLKNRIIDYLASCRAKNKPPTKSGLMTHLKMHRDQFYQYANYPEYRDIMEQTSNFMENWYEENLILNRCNGSGIQFALKNRFGWKDTQTVEVVDNTPEDQLIRKIEALAPDLVGFFQKSKPMEQIELKKDLTLEGEFTDEQYARFGNEVVTSSDEEFANKENI